MKELISLIKQASASLVRDKKNAPVDCEKNKFKYLYSLMAILLAKSSETFSWTDEALAILLTNKKSSKVFTHKVQEFCSNFWKNKNADWDKDN